MQLKFEHSVKKCLLALYFLSSRAWLFDRTVGSSENYGMLLHITKITVYLCPPSTETALTRRPCVSCIVNSIELLPQS